MTNEQCANVAETAWNLANEPGTNFSASVALKDCVITIKELQARLAELESRLEIDERHPIDGIAARDATIKYQDERIAELEKDSAKNKVDAECFRWWVHEAAANPSLVAKAISHCITEDEYRDVICGAMEAKNAAIDTAMQKD